VPCRNPTPSFQTLLGRSVWVQLIASPRVVKIRRLQVAALTQTDYLTKNVIVRLAGLRTLRSGPNGSPQRFSIYDSAPPVAFGARGIDDRIALNQGA
jgi:hypothetical protein